MNVDLDELVLFDDSAAVGDTFIFEPSHAEEQLGRLLVAAETGDREGDGRGLLDTAVHALQREYYRDPSRGVLASFESALHQANLVLHDLAEQGTRDWVGTFHAAVGVLAKTKLHLSTAGEGVVLLARQSRLTSVSSGLSHSPITDPLRTFAQVASGVVSTRDVLFFGTSQLNTIFRYDDLARLSIDRAAATVTTRLRQLYEDQHNTMPVAVLVASMLPEHAALTRVRDQTGWAQREPVSRVSHLAPRQPLAIHRSLFKRILFLIGMVLSLLWQRMRQVVWPLVKEGSRRSGTALYRASRTAGENVKSLARRTGDSRARLVPQKISVGHIRERFRLLPRSSKFFAVMALILALALSASLILLQKKRTADEQIQRTSELLHEARTKKEAADTALIYDNRDQAHTLLGEAHGLAQQIETTRLYQEQTQELLAGIVIAQDRLNKVTRLTQDVVREVGDFAPTAGSDKLSRLFYLNGALYSYSARDNTIVRMATDGATSVANKTTQGIGFFVAGTTHEADKALVLITDSPGAALYDAKTQLLQKQELTLPSSEPEILSVSTYGNRMYMYDHTAGNIFGYNKTLRGYSGASAWITDDDFPRDTIRSIGIDGYIYTLHEDGSVRKLLKGVPVEFTLENIEPALSGSSRLLITADLGHLYILDPPNQRVAIFDTVGNLSRQVFLGEIQDARDIAVDPDETDLYVLAGTKVWAFSLSE
jgi:hypothetical protein